ncbi:hypothetical protein L208DRAFT_1393957 [Tricholoma matsutake]|nr:hypothetical protein L208DRAFT_1393957 [Tricholoma matsutake 945]
MIVQVELGGRSHKAGDDSVEMTNIMLTMVAEDTISTQVSCTEGLHPDTEVHLCANRDIEATSNLPIRDKDSPHGDV